MNIQWKYVFSKVESVVFDRRLWVSIFTLIFVFSGAAESVNGTDTLSDQAVDLVVLLAGIVQNVLWTVRAPSGLGNVLDKLMDELND